MNEILIEIVLLSASDRYHCTIEKRNGNRHSNAFNGQFYMRNSDGRSLPTNFSMANVIIELMNPLKFPKAYIQFIHI